MTTDDVMHLTPDLRIAMNPFDEFRQNVTRRHFLAAGSHLLGTAALASLAGDALASAANRQPRATRHALTHFAPKAKQVIYLHMVGGPSQMDLFDYKPVMREWYDKDLPESVRMGQRLTTMTSGQARFPIAPSMYKFEQCGQSGMWVSELLPWMKKMADDVRVHPQHAHRGDQPRAGDHAHANRQPGDRPAVPGGVGVVRPGLAQRQSADVRRDGRPQHEHRAGAGDLGPAVVERLSARRACGRELPHGGRPDSVHQRSARRAARRPPREARRRSTRSTS